MTYSAPPLGDVIRKYRKAQGLTQAQLAEKLELTTRQVMYIESGKSYPKYETLCRIVQVLSIPPDHIFYPMTELDDPALISFLELYRSCPSEDQRIVLATAQALTEQLK